MRLLVLDVPLVIVVLYDDHLVLDSQGLTRVLSPFLLAYDVKHAVGVALPYHDLQTKLGGNRKKRISPSST